MINKLAVLFIGTTVISISLLIFNKKKQNPDPICGTLRIDRSLINDDNREQLFLELHVPVSQLCSLKRISLTILNEDYICAKKTISVMNDGKSIKGDTNG